ncbi:probable fucosyltransferase 8 [Gastrolobium bilobum]|uniref:probable fucosyltransferase 8 n=1 Tax=Gastrolobium bilobum TaxID=150636 RepID=UPI002AB078DA|nr:probable fucosyltransferase 8 [Gastrolobium bilobum]
MEKKGLSSKRFTTFFVVFFMAFPVVIIVTLMYRNSNFPLFEVLSKGKVLGETALNVTTKGFPLGGRVHDTSDENFKGRNNGTVSELFFIQLPFALYILLWTETHSLYYLNGLGEVKVQGKFQNGTPNEGRATANKNITPSEVDLKNSSMKSSTNDSTPLASNLDDKDKLLHGLLASGFDETSCISRVQSHLYRKASPHKPSPYLISKLRNYEEIHRRCGPNSRAYNRSMTKIVHSKKSGAAAAAMCKYLVWTPVNGLGNQMISMVATFLYGVLTDRVLLVKFGKDKHGLFCEPFLNSTWILPEESPLWNEQHVETYQTMLEKDSASNSKEDLPSALFLDLHYTHGNTQKLFHCDHSQDLLRKVPLLILQSDQYFVPSLFMTPFFNQEITKMFPEKDTVFHHLGRYLFHPSNEAWGLISKFYQAYLAKADERLGLQIRVFSPNSTPQQAVMNLVLSCTIKHKLLPQVDMQNSVSSAGKKNTVKAVLVTSLYPEYAENLRSMYMKKPTVTGEVIEVYQPSHEEQQKFHDNKHNMKALTEMYLLSLSDVLVTTSLSTFGYVAQGLGGLKPWLLYKLVSNETHFPPCERDFSLEPCYHSPPKHYCNGKPIKDFVSSFSYMRECKDYSFGVKAG